jgi:GNAT superfamily N-acetyltransferase
VAGLLVKPVDALSDDQLAQVRVIYEGAFSRDLRVPFSDLIQSGPVDRTFVAIEGDAPAGFAALRLLGSAGWSFLRYFAVARERRSQGLGQQFWPLLRESLRADGWPARVIFEVEDPGDAAADETERAIRERRIGFWTACGARLLPASQYVLPDYTSSGTTEPMLLMAAASVEEPAVRGDQLRKLVLAIYTDRYGMAADDPLVARALAAIAT